MAYDRYDRDERSRWSDDRSDRGWHERSRHDRHGGREERGFFERMGDEVRSWFGDDDDDRGYRSERDRGFGRPSGEFRGRERGREREFGRDLDRGSERGVFSRGAPSERDYNPDWNRSAWGSGEQDRGRDRDFERSRSFGRDRDREFERGGGRSYRPMTGDYGRGTEHESDQFFAASGFGRGQRPFGGYDRDQERGRDRDYDRSETPYGRDEYRRTSFAGSRKDDRDFDPHYRDWRERHLSDIDRDYDDYRRERQSRFESDFGSWREQRQQKRSLLGQVREHMEVVGRDDEHLGTVDRIAGDRIILTKSDPESGGAHHSLPCTLIDRVEGDRVILDRSADEARHQWRDENRSRALFEREDQGEMGPGILDRSFSGTYR